MGNCGKNTVSRYFLITIDTFSNYFVRIHLLQIGKSFWKMYLYTVSMYLETESMYLYTVSTYLDAVSTYLDTVSMYLDTVYVSRYTICI